METILIVNGEKYWQDFLPEFKVVQKRIQNSSWVIKENALWVVDENGAIKPDCILWRVGAIRPSEHQRTALNLIELSKVPCINSPSTLKLGYDRLSMLSVLKNCDLPVIKFNVATKSVHLKNIELEFPFVVKAGNYHGGYGKVLVSNEKQWQDIKDLLFISEEYITIEPYINYKKDIRYLVIKDKIWAMSGNGKFWKANIETKAFKLFQPKKEQIDQIKKLQTYLKADIIAIDILEEHDGTHHIVEYNDIPGLSGFPDSLKFELASVVKEKLFQFFKEKTV